MERNYDHSLVYEKNTSARLTDTQRSLCSSGRFSADVRPSLIISGLIKPGGRGLMPSAPATKAPD